MEMDPGPERTVYLPRKCMYETVLSLHNPYSDTDTDICCSMRQNGQITRLFGLRILLNKIEMFILSVRELSYVKSKGIFLAYYTYTLQCKQTNTMSETQPLYNTIRNDT